MRGVCFRPSRAARPFPRKLAAKDRVNGICLRRGVKRNAGRPGAAGAPDALRKALANMASHQGHERLVDLGNWVAPTPDLEGAQQALRDAVPLPAGRDAHAGVGRRA